MTELLDTGQSWPDVATVPRAPVRASIAARLLRRVAKRCGIRVQTPEGAGFGPTDAPILQLHRPHDFYHRVGVGGLIGFGESYQAGDWDCDDLAEVLTLLAGHIDNLVPRGFHWVRRGYVAAMPDSQDNSERNAAANISHHYDLSNELFRLFLDETMTYSAALFDTYAATADNLAAAQRVKIDRLLDATGVGPGSRVLEIGTGWGELAIRAAERGAIVDTITLSQEQRDWARDAARQRGVADRVNIELRDYRDLTTRDHYDAVLSIEMIEAVGRRYWPQYFATLRRVLAPGGRVGLQAITMPHHRMMATRDTYTWIHKYIFPGGLIPSVRAIEEQLGQQRLRLIQRQPFGLDYAATLRLWRERFANRTTQLDDLGFDAVFRRTWQLYLAYSQAGFASQYLNVWQFTAGRSA